ncbi:MAG: carboxypeptidase regulatory-like domain-containing protein [Planctomycetaceae bacterium]|nr:carboxypeptidase regulatory-like domain-containing protein [Planctomycetaceae bacterium]
MAEIRQVERFERRCLLSGATGGAPDLLITKGVVSSSQSAAVFDAPTAPGSVTFAAPGTDQPFVGTLSSEAVRSGTAAVPINANLINARPGETIRLAIVVENQSTVGGAFDVTIQDTLPAGLAYVANSLRVVSGSGARLSWTEAGLTSDGSGLFAAGIEIDDPGATNGTLAAADHCGSLDALSTGLTGNNIAVLTYDATVRNPTGNTGTFSSDVTLLAFAQTEGGTNLSAQPGDVVSVGLERIDLQLTTSVSPSSPLAGDVVTWTVNAANNSAEATTAATGVVVSVAVPAGQQIVPGSVTPPGGDAFDESTSLWTLSGSVTPGQTRQLTFQTIAAVSVTLPSDFVDVEIDAVFDRTSLVAGQTVTYEITAFNNPEGATTAATGLTIDGLLPPGLSLVSSSTSAGSFAAATGVWDLTAVSVGRGQSETLSITGTVDAAAAGTTINLTPEVTALTQTDVDSVAANSSTDEDDDLQQAFLIAPDSTTRNVSGRVFLDANNNGINNSELGVAGITVSAFDENGALAATAVTTAGGDYTLVGVTSAPLRLEFTGLNVDQSVTTALSPPASNSTFSSIAFVSAGSAAVTADLAVYRPADQALFVTTCFIYSGQSSLDPTTEPAVVVFNADGSIKTTIATIAQVGATNGLAVHPSSGDQFVAAFQKRHADIGPGGNSTIYRIDASGGVSTFVRLEDFFGADYAGPASHDPSNWFTDAPAFGTSGKMALGDVDVSDDGDFLYTINLATRELLQIPIRSGGDDPVDYVAGDSRTIERFAIFGDDLVTPTNGGIATGQLGADPVANIRPFALTVRDGLVYVGMVNSAESTTFTSDLNAYVYAFNPATQTFSTTAAVDFPLGTRSTGGGWQAWTSDWDDLPKFYDAAGDYFAVGRNQPWLTDIEFDTNGDMILGFRDRTGDEVGHMVGDPTGADSDGIGGPDRFFHDTKGDILRLRQAAGGTWTPEAGHTAGDGSEYYAEDEATFDPLAATLHPESAQGALVQVPGAGHIVTTAIDPQSFWAGGVIALDNATGEQVDQLDIYSGSDAADILTFGKNNGLGDLEYVGNLSHEIGNRVWQDVNANGVQDAGEPALAGIDLQLIDISDPAVPVIVGATTTNSAGEYAFNDSNVVYTDGGAAVGLRSLTDYRVQVVTAELQPGGSLFGQVPTLSDQSPVLVPRTRQAVSGTAEFDTDQNTTPDTPRNQRFDLLTTAGLRSNGVRIVITNMTGGFARVDSDQSVIFEFAAGSTAGSFEYQILDERLDSDALGRDDNEDGLVDQVFAEVTTGAAGWSDHSVDLGFRPASADVSLVTTSSQQQAVSGDTIRFQLTVTNSLQADLTASDLIITNRIPSGLTLLPGSVTTTSGSLSGTNVTTWTLGSSLRPGESASLQYLATVDGGLADAVLITAAEVSGLSVPDIDSETGNDNGDRSEDDEDDVVLLVGTLGNSTVTAQAQVVAADQFDFDSVPGNDDQDQSEDDEGRSSYTLSTVTNAFDYGDLPDVYRTTTGSGGPSHRRGSPTFLGQTVDDEADGQPSLTASADGADEDGVRFLTPLIPGSTASVQVTTSTAGFLNAWIDFDADGTLDELQITTIDGTALGTPVAARDLPLTAGVHVLSINVPATAGGQMAARFRYTSDAMGGLRSTGGVWENGEVEDYVLRELGDRVWFDHNGDGVVDAGTEAGLPGLTVILTADLNGDGTPETYTTLTDANGRYRFSGLPAGRYDVSVVPPAAAVATFDVDGGTDSTAAIEFGAGDSSRDDVDFGYQGTGLIGDLVWQDVNANGFRDGSESGFGSVALVLTGDLNGDGVTDITHTTATDANGAYDFGALVSGDYTVTVTPPADTQPTFDADSIATPNVSVLALAAGSVSRTQDFGYRIPPSGPSGRIGDVIWNDANGNGLRDPGESGIAGVTVQLAGDIDGDGTSDVTLSTNTDADGRYEFGALAAGNYTITVVPPASASATFDADGIATLHTTELTLTSDEQNLTIDFGYLVTSTSAVDLAVLKESDAAADAAPMGSEVVYSVRVTNNGPDDAVDAVVTDVLPSAFASATWTASGTSGAVFTTAGSGNLTETVSLPAGGAITWIVTATLEATFSGTVSNTATVSTSQTDSNPDNNQSTDTLTVSPLTLTPETDPQPGAPFQIGARGMSHVSLVPFVVGTVPGTGTINGVTVDIADPQIFMVGFVCVDDRIIAVYDIPETLSGETLYFQAYETTPVPRLSNLVTAVVGSPGLVIAATGNATTITEGSTQDSVAVALSEPPSGSVTVDIQNERPDRVVTDQTSLTFTAANWDTPQVVTLSAVDDGLVNGNERTNVVFKIRAGSDQAFANAFSKTVRVDITDNDVLQTPGLTDSHTSTPEPQPLITWGTVAGADSYDIWVSPSNSVSTPSDDTTVRGTSFTPQQPLSIGRHVVWVRARSDSGDVSSWSAPATIDITTAPTVSVSSLTAQFQMTVTWTPVPGAATYEVWANNLTTGTSKAFHSTTETDLSFTTASLNLGRYSVWVRGVTANGRAGSWSAAQPLSVAAVPQTPGATFDRQSQFTWTSPSGAATWEIYLQQGSSVIRQAGLTTTSFTPGSPLANNTDYRWWVRGFTHGGEAGPWSAAALARIGGRPTITTPGDGQTVSLSPVFTWTAVDGGISYDLFVFQVDTGTLAFRQSVSEPRYAHGTALSAGSYRVWVRALSSTGAFSPWSTLVEFNVA